MKFVSLNGYIEEDSSYISMEVEGADNDNSIGDSVWFSRDGTEMEITDMIEQDVYDEVKEMFDGNSRRAFAGAMMRMGINF